MLTDLELLDRAKEQTGSDSETGRLVGMKQGHICDVRNGRRELSAAQAGQIAELIGKPWIEEVFPRLAKKERSHKAGRFWMGKPLQLQKIAQRGAMVALLAMILPHGGSSASPGFEADHGSNVYYVKLMLTFLAAYFFASSATKRAMQRNKKPGSPRAFLSHLSA